MKEALGMKYQTSKVCNVCGQVRSLDDFHNKKNAPDGKAYVCKPCKAAYDKEYTTLNKDKIKEQKKVYYKDKSRAGIEELREYFGGEFRCSKCGYTNDCWAPFDLHHLDMDEKEFGIAEHYLKGIDVIKEELDKCVLLCARCHREEHYCE